MSEPRGAGGAWTEERGTSDEGRRHPEGAPQASGRQSTSDEGRRHPEGAPQASGRQSTSDEGRRHLMGVPAASGKHSDRLREIEKEIFARRPEHSINPSLDRIRSLVTLLGDPQRAYPVIHITGTNGKTSTARMTERLLRARGLRTGLFTSPHLTSIPGRICVHREPLSAAQFISADEG